MKAKRFIIVPKILPYHARRSLMALAKSLPRHPWKGSKKDARWPGRAILIIWKRNTLEDVVRFINPRGYTLNINLEPWTK